MTLSLEKLSKAMFLHDWPDSEWSQREKAAE